MSSVTQSGDGFDWTSRRASYILATLLEKHVVGLYVNVSGKAGDKGTLYSGFLLEVKGVTYWITAGHVIDKLVPAISDPTVRIMNWIDGFTRPGAQTVPVNRRRVKCYSAMQFDRDSGFIMVPPHDAANLRVNRQPMHELLWQGLDSFQPIGFYLLGFPNSGHHVGQSEMSGNSLKAIHHADMECLPVEWIDRNTIDIRNEAKPGFWEAPEALYGRIVPFSDAPDAQPEDIEGMSGGPLIGLEAPTETETSYSARYRLYGVQSRWLDKRRIIRAVPTLPFIQLIEDAPGEAGH